MIDTLLTILFVALTLYVVIRILIIGIKAGWAVLQIVACVVTIPIVLGAIFAFTTVAFALVGVIAIGIISFLIVKRPEV